MLKKISFALFSSGFAFYAPPLLAQPAPVHAGKYAYAAPCESVQPESRRLKLLQAQLQAKPKQSAQIIEQFWNIAQQGTPLAEKIDAQNSRIIFLWRGATHNVRLIGGPSNDHEWLTRLPNTDIWFVVPLWTVGHLPQFCHR
jgi:enterochelin esterase family protein